MVKKQESNSHSEGKCAIYIDSIFLERALCSACVAYSNMYPDFEWNSLINSINIAKLAPFLIEYAGASQSHEEMKNSFDQLFSGSSDKNNWLESYFTEESNWPGFFSASEIDIYVIRAPEFSRVVYTDSKLITTSRQKINILLQDVYPTNIYEPNPEWCPTLTNGLNDSAIAPLLNIKLITNKHLKKYKGICLVGIDKEYDMIIDHCLKKGIPIMRYRVTGRTDIGGIILEDKVRNNNILWQDIRYPIARTWGIKHHEL